MSVPESKVKYPQDIVAIFHASFHPTQGNTIDWCTKASDDLNLDNLEFSALPSGLHLVEQDVVYFTKDDQHGVCVFRRRKTGEEGHRGFRLSSLGVLLAKSHRPRPWRHVSGLKELITKIYSQCAESGLLQPTGSQWEPAQAFFDERKVRRADLGGAGDWSGWSHELNDIGMEAPYTNPTLHLPHLLRILGPSSLTLYKHVLGRRRILIYTLPPVEAACILCQVAADMCYEAQQNAPMDGDQSQQSLPVKLKAINKEPINVLGMITLSDMDRLHSKNLISRGWIACTTDAIFLEKPSCYDLLIDLTTSTPNKATRPTFYVSKPILPPPSNARHPTYRLSMIRFAWSDVKLWNELDRILQLDSNSSPQHSCCGPSTDPVLKSKLISPWVEMWRVYEDVCVICAGLWMGSWRNNSTMSYSTAGGPENWGKIRLDGDDDLSLGGSGYIRSLGMGIEGRPVASASTSQDQSQLGVGIAPLTPTNKAMRRSRGMSWSSGKATIVGTTPGIGNDRARQASSSTTIQSEGEGLEMDYDGDERRDGQLLTTLSLLQTFHAHTYFQLSTLESLIPPEQDTTLFITPKDIFALELSPYSGFDAKYLEWLVQEYAATARIVVKRGWKDLLSALFGYA